MDFSSKNRERMKSEAIDCERKLAANPLAAVEVDPETAEFMGAFRETAVSLEDFRACEPGVLDWLFEPREGPRKSGRRG